MNNALSKNNRRRGRWAEFLACWYLRLHGYRVLYRNYAVRSRQHAGAGEVDIIACRKKMLVFAEVKTRRSLQKAAYAVTPRQKQRLTRAALSFLQLHPQYAGYQIRFDAVLVRLPLTVKHIPDAWRP